MSEQAAVPLPAPKSLMSRIIGVIVSPGETFQDVARHPAWLPPLIIYLALFVVAFGVYSMKADWVGILTEQIENMGIMKMLSEEARDNAVKQATESVRNLTQVENSVQNILNAVTFTVPFFHAMSLIYATLFVLMGALADLKLGRAWLQFVWGFLMLVGYGIIAVIANTAFKGEPMSILLLTCSAGLIMAAAWIWLISRSAKMDPAYHRVLAVCTHGGVVLMVSIIALLATSLAMAGPITTPMESLVPSNIGAWVKTGNAVLDALLGSLDVFVIWWLAVLTIGFRVVTKLSTGVAASITFLPWGVVVLVRLAIAAVAG